MPKTYLPEEALAPGRHYPVTSGRHHPGILGAIILVYLGGFVVISSGAHRERKKALFVDHPLTERAAPKTFAQPNYRVGNGAGLALFAASARGKRN